MILTSITILKRAQLKKGPLTALVIYCEEAGSLAFLVFLKYLLHSGI